MLPLKNSYICGENPSFNHSQNNEYRLFIWFYYRGGECALKILSSLKLYNYISSYKEYVCELISLYLQICHINYIEPLYTRF
jgi:hypothetical protein